jgi:hypothetical protein
MEELGSALREDSDWAMSHCLRFDLSDYHWHASQEALLVLLGGIKVSGCFLPSTVQKS